MAQAAISDAESGSESYDVRVVDDNYNNFLTAWTGCPPEAQVSGSHPNKVCRGQKIHVNLQNVSGYTVTQRRGLACHELGHTVTLRHVDNPGAASCMRVNVTNRPTTYSGHDQNMITRTTRSEDEQADQGGRRDGDTRGDPAGRDLVWWALVLPGCLSEAGRGKGSSPTPSPPDAASPSGDRPALELWDNFGAPEGHEVGRYETLRAMVRGAHAVVAGRVDRVDGDRVYGEDQESALLGIRVTLQVTNVFKGDLRVGDSVPVVVGLADLRDDVEAKFAELIGDEGIFFIIPGGAPQPEFGVVQEAPELGLEWRPVTSQGVVINDRGSSAFAMNIVDRGFPASLDRIPFPEIENRVRQAVQG
ncbi:MAG: hypothetical protein ACRDHV_05615 [Actinomycetota bacterium]